MADCHGCEFSCLSDRIQDTVLIAFFPAAGTEPDGECVDQDTHCAPSPCVPVGAVGVINNSTLTTLKFHPSAGGVIDIPQGPWQGILDLTPPGLTVACGSEWIAGEVKDHGQDPVALICKVVVGCSKCEQDL